MFSTMVEINTAADLARTAWAQSHAVQILATILLITGCVWILECTQIVRRAILAMAALGSIGASAIWAGQLHDWVFWWLW